MSKSLGNGIDPLAVVDSFGADALRFTVIAGAAVGTDVIMDPDDLEATFAPGRNFCNKLWNVGRFVLSNLEEKDGRGRSETAQDGPRRGGAGEEALADAWILSRLEATTAEVTDAMERFRLNDATNAAYRFVWSELADWYLEAAKPRLRGDASGGARAREVLRLALERALCLLHPVVPFITETLWQRLPGREGESLVTAPWPSADPSRLDEDAERRFGLVQQVVNAVRSIRADYDVPARARLAVFVQDADEETRATLTAEHSTIAVLAGVGDFSFDEPPSGPGASAVLHGATTVFAPLGDAVDVERECGRLRAERDRLRELLNQVEAKLANERFTGRAPAEVVARERAKAQSWSERCEALDAKLAALGCH
jgi:valyl-tRNA synthetase